MYKLSVLILFLVGFSAHAQIYVDVNATGANNGSSWADAYNHLNTALASATSGTEIRVAQGNYYPDLGTGAIDNDRNASFILPDGVTLLGGYNATTNVRDVANFLTILNGDLQQNSTSTDDAIHVITIGEVTATIDGFSISNGNANGSFPHSEGGAIYINTSINYNLTINQCTFLNNNASSGGGAIRIADTTLAAAGSITIDNSAFNNNTSFNGGAIKLGNNVTLSNSTFSTNIARFGGAMYIDGGTSIITNCTFSNNTTNSSGVGGAVYTRLKSDDAARFDTCSFLNNASPNNEAGAIAIETATGSGYTKGIEVEDCTFTGNTAVFGAAIRAENANDIRIINSTFNANIASSSGGAIGIYALASGTQPFISGCIFTNNSAAGNGGNSVFLQSSNATVENCLFDGNGNGSSFDSAIGFQASSATIHRCKIINNNAWRIIRLSSSATPKISNCFIANNNGVLFSSTNFGVLTVENNTIVNNATVFQTNSSSTQMLLYNNIVWGNTKNFDTFTGTVDTNIIEGGYASGTNIYTTDPLFTDAANADYTLTSGSPAVDAGNNTYVTAAKDLAGENRIKRGLVDLGAYESNYCFSVPEGILYVDASNTTNPKIGTSWANALTSLQEALEYATTCTSSTITEIRVAKGTYFADDSPTKTAGDRDASFVLPSGITVLGGFPTGGSTLNARNFTSNPTILSGDIGVLGNDTDNTYHIITTLNVAANTKLDGFIVEKGYNNKAARSSDGGRVGAAWYNLADGVGFSSLPNAVNCIFRDNYAGSYGGAIYNDANTSTIAEMVFTNCQFLNNFGDRGGAICDNPRSVTATSTKITVENCYFKENTSSQNGGAISSDGTNTGLLVFNSVFYKNSSGSSGPIYIVGNGNNQIINSIFYQNSNSSTGPGTGALFKSSLSEISVKNSIFWGNTAASTSNVFEQQIYGFDANEYENNHIQGYTGSANNNVGTDPLFVDAANGNFQLQAASTAINSGLNAANTTSLDFAGNARIIDTTIDRGAYEFIGTLTPQIEIQGNAIAIVNGDSTPEVADNTNFGSTPSTGTNTKTFAIVNTGSVALHLTENTTGLSDYVSLTGASAFTITSQPTGSIAPGTSSNFQITYTPDCATLTAETATISIASSATTASPYTFTIQSIIDATVDSAFITCAPDVTFTADAGMCSASQPIGSPTINGCATVTNDAPATFPVGNTTVTWSLNNPSGNVVTCTQIVTVVDSESPLVTCPTDLTVNSDVGTCGAVVTFALPVATDNCGIASITQTRGLPSGSAFPIGSTTNKFTITDTSGNTTTCSFRVTVNDGQAPTLSLSDISLPLDATGNLVVHPNNLFSPYTVSQTGTFQSENITSTGIAVTLDDEELSASLPVGFNFEFNGVAYSQFYISSNGFITFDGSLDSFPDTDEEFIALAFSDLDPSVGGTISYKTIGTSPNRILIVDFTDIPYYESTNADVTTQIKLFETTNNIEIHTTNISDPEDYFYGITQGIYIGNTRFGVADREDYYFTLTNDYVSFEPTSAFSVSDCDSSTISFDRTTFTCDDLGPQTITVTATDGSGNASNNTFVLTITDNTAPVFNSALPADFIAVAGARDEYTVTDFTGGITADDNCNYTITQNPTVGSKLRSGIHTITISAVDNNGNSTDHTFTATITSTYNTFLGTTNNLWSEASNWSFGTVPIATENTLISTGVSTVVDAVANVNELIVDGTLTVLPEYAITINDRLTQNGTLTIQSNATHSGSLILKEYHFGYEEVTYQRYVTSDWHIISLPFKGFTQRISDFKDLLARSGNKYAIATYDNSLETNRYVYYTDNTGSNDIDNLDGALFEEGKGYSVKKSVAGTLNFKGFINTRFEINENITDNSSGVGNKWNLVGNPYTSAIALNDDADATNNLLTVNAGNLDPARVAIYQWNAGTASYDIINHSDEVAKYAAPGQGFFVEANVGGTISFPKTIQKHQTGNVFSKTALTTPQILLSIAKENTIKTTKIKYLENTTTGLDPGYDAGVFSGESSSFSIFTHLVTDNTGVPFALQCLPTTNLETMVIPVGILSEANQTITISAESVNLPTGIHTYLEDTETGAFINLNEEEYLLTTKTALEGVGRFFLHTKSNVLSNDNESFSANISMFKTANHTLRILGLIDGNATIRLFDVLGKEVFTKKFKGQRKTDIILPNLKAAVYMVSLQSETGKKTQKIIIE